MDESRSWKVPVVSAFRLRRLMGVQVRMRNIPDTTQPWVSRRYHVCHIFKQPFAALTLRDDCTGGASGWFDGACHRCTSSPGAIVCICVHLSAVFAMYWVSDVFCDGADRRQGAKHAITHHFGYFQRRTAPEPQRWTSHISSVEGENIARWLQDDFAPSLFGLWRSRS